ncbi:MAG: S-layer homology domain-containing protein [Clostridia bacterium]|nr:S-layer homology domain-containing protein [Clostridia bacterium]
MRNVKRALSLVLVLALALTMCVVGAGAAKYSDVPSTYAYSSEVQFLSDIEVITGYPDGTFKPENTITRGEAAAVIFRTLAGKESAAQNYQGVTQFSDVSAEHWACGYVNFCTEMGIINGYPDGTFKPDQTVTYAEYVTMLSRALGLDIGKDLSYPYGYIAEATVEGINYGVDLGANDPAPRGSVAKLTYNAIFDATYKRIANNIYTTRKPTIAENVLKLQTMEGVISSIGDYDWTGSGTAGDGKIMLDYADDLDSNTFAYNGAYGDTWVGDYELDNSYLGKEVKIWYKEDAVSASGQKIYAVIEKTNTSATLPHIVIRGLIGDDQTKHQITYALNDVDYKAKLDNQVILVENNEAWGNLDFVAATATAEADLAIFVGVRAWLPVTWTFIDKDNNGKYDIIHRMVYGFDKVSGINSDVITLENFGSVDRTENGKAYAWNDGLEDVGEDDWVIFYSDGAVTKGAATPVATYLAMRDGSTFDEAGLYGDTDYAIFQKMDFATLAVEKISDHDRYVFDGTTFRTWSANGNYYKDLVSGTTINAEIGDEFDLWYTKQFGGIIASAESADMSTGNFIVLYALESSAPDVSRPNANFTVYGFDEKGNDVDFTVKGNKTKGLKEYLAGDGETRTANNIPLNYANLDALIGHGAGLGAANGPSGYPYTLCEYKMNSANQITELNVYGNIYEVVNTAGDYKTYFNTKTQVLNKKYNVQDNALVFAINGAVPANATVRVLTGSFPKVSGATADIVGYKLKDGEDVKALATVITTGHFSSSDTEDIIGYLRAIDKFDDHYEYTIAYGDDAATVISSRAGDIDTIVADDDLFTLDDWSTQLGRKAGMIMFDITGTGNIENMRALTTAAMTTVETNADSEYLAAFVVEKVDSAKKTVTLRPITNANVNSSAKPISGADLWSAAEVAGIFAEYDAGVGEVFSLASSANVFVINPSTTNQANVKLGTLGDLQKATTDAAGNITRGMVVTLAYNGDDDEIIAIFANKEVVK